MFKQNTCIPCQGGVPALNSSEIIEYRKLVSEQWIVEDSKHLLKEFKFDIYLDAIKFSNKVAILSSMNHLLQEDTICALATRFKSSKYLN